MEFTADQIMQMAGAVITGLVTAIGALFAWMLNRINKLDGKLDACEYRHAEVSKELLKISEKAGRLEGRVEEMERYSPKELANEIAERVKELIRS